MSNSPWRSRTVRPPTNSSDEFNDRYTNEESNRDFRQAVHIFEKRLNGGEVPGSVEHIPTTTSRNYNPIPDSGDMLDWEADVLPMVEATRNPRNVALITVAWDSRPVGARSPISRSATSRIAATA